LLYEYPRTWHPQPGAGKRCAAVETSVRHRWHFLSADGGLQRCKRPQRPPACPPLFAALQPSDRATVLREPWALTAKARTPADVYISTRAYRSMTQSHGALRGQSHGCIQWLVSGRCKIDVGQGGQRALGTSHVLHWRGGGSGRPRSVPQRRSQVPLSIELGIAGGSRPAIASGLVARAAAPPPVLHTVPGQQRHAHKHQAQHGRQHAAHCGRWGVFGITAGRPGSPPTIWGHGRATGPATARPAGLAGRQPHELQSACDDMGRTQQRHKCGRWAIGCSVRPHWG